MKTVNKPPDGMKRLSTSLLRLLVKIASHPALANHTPAGPGSLAAGQGAAAARGGHAAGYRWESHGNHHTAPTDRSIPAPEFAYTRHL